MASNQKLTKLLAGRALAGSARAEGLLTATFADGSTMRVETGPTAAVTPAGANPTAPAGPPALAPTAPAGHPPPRVKRSK